ncbi:hypothetical protein T484DRAFT_3633353 [Baffinella frigidus]|nr:hypothetical protein T484DRAFT_3633353 [Cryptophyta sp. CCMP2293]
MDTEIPSCMQKLVLMSTSRKAYKLAADSDDFEIAEVVQDVPNAKTFTAMPDDDGNRSALAPEVITHTFTRSVLILCEFFFIAPVIYVSAFVLVQERTIPVEVQNPVVQDEPQSENPVVQDEPQSENPVVQNEPQSEKPVVQNEPQSEKWHLTQISPMQIATPSECFLLDLMTRHQAPQFVSCYL